MVDVDINASYFVKKKKYEADIAVSFIASSMR
jgi:hypothetical protein